MKVSKYFTKEEIACKCGCGFATMSEETLEIADYVRELIGIPITPSSGCRCKEHNKKEGGKKESYHLGRNGVGMGMDLPVPDPKFVYEALCRKYPKNKYGFIAYETFIHVDSRPLAYRKIM